MLSAIVCMDNFGVIGKNGDLLYRIPDDLKRFKEITIGHWVIMGRKTWNSIGNNPLPGRTNIVISSTLNFSMTETNKYTNYETSVNIWKNVTKEKIKFYAEQPEEYFVIGGQSIYEIFLPYCDKVYATIVPQYSTEADTFFPIKLLKDDDWEEIDNGVPCYSSNDIGYVFGFKTYVRKKDIKQTYKSSNSHAYSDPVSGHNAVDNPSHYCGTKYQVINFIEDWGLGYCLGNVVKYICRAGKKYVGDKQKELQDLKKAKWYLERRLEEHKNGVELDSNELKMNISIDDFIEDQKLNYVRKKIIKNVIDCICEEIDTKFYTALELLDTEINRMEDETA